MLMRMLFIMVRIWHDNALHRGPYLHRVNGHAVDLPGPGQVEFVVADLPALQPRFETFRRQVAGRSAPQPRPSGARGFYRACQTPLYVI